MPVRVELSLVLPYTADVF